MIEIFQKGKTNNTSYDLILIDNNSIGDALNYGYNYIDLVTTPVIDKESNYSLSRKGVQILDINKEKNNGVFFIYNSTSTSLATNVLVGKTHNSSIIGMFQIQSSIDEENFYKEKGDLGLFEFAMSASLKRMRVLLFTRDRDLRRSIRRTDQCKKG